MIMQNLFLFEIKNHLSKGFFIKESELPPFDSITEVNLYCAKNLIKNYIIKDSSTNSIIYSIINDPKFGIKKDNTPGPRFCSQDLKEGARLIIPPVTVNIGHKTKASFWSESFMTESINRKELLKTPPYCYFNIVTVTEVNAEGITLEAVRISTNTKPYIQAEFSDSKPTYIFKNSIITVKKRHNKILFI